MTSSPDFISPVPPGIDSGSAHHPVSPASNSLDCWHCSLVSYRVSYLSASAMHHFAGYILPGLIFLALGLRWVAQLVLAWTRRPEVVARPRASRSHVRAACRDLPWEGIVKLLLTGLGILVSVLAARPRQEDAEYVSHIRYATVYLFFSLSGLVDILVYYCGYTVLPEGVQSFILSLAFVVEGVLFAMRLRFEAYLEQQIHILLVVVVLACAIVCILEVLYDNRLVKFSRAYLCVVQGTWLIHGGFIMQGDGTAEAATYPDSLEWVSILFSWHVAGNFILFVATLLLSHQFHQNTSDRFAGGGVLPCLAPSASAAGSTAVTPTTPTSTASFHSPASVQTSNASPVFLMAGKEAPLGLPSFAYIQSKQLPSLPVSAQMPPAPPSGQQSARGLSVILHQHNAQNVHGQPTSVAGHHALGRYQRQHQHQLHDDRTGSSTADSSSNAGQPSPASGQTGVSPVIVEAVPRDNIAVSEEYRTLSREDELRASIKLKESSLI